MRWPDLHKLAVVHFTASLSGVWVSTRVPADLEERLPALRVIRGPGDDDGITDAPLLDVESFAASEGAVWGLAEDARQAAHALAGSAVSGALVDSVTTATGPVYLDYGNPAVWRVVASYRVQFRKRP